MANNRFIKSMLTGLVFVVSTQSMAQQSEAPIRLEVTIKGSKEQPQVLSIVPWQLPEHRAIEGSLAWPLNAMELRLIQRKSFMRNLAITRSMVPQDGLNRTPENSQP